MVKESDAEGAANYIRDNAADYAKAKAERIYIEQFRKTKKAILCCESGEKTDKGKENYAYAHDDYQELLTGWRGAVEKEEEIKWLMEAARLKIEIWRTQQANNRTIDMTHK